MIDAEFQKAKATFPWRHQLVQNGLGGQIHVLDKDGKEVPLFQMIEVVEHLTAHIARGPTPKADG